GGDRRRAGGREGPERPAPRLPDSRPAGRAGAVPGAGGAAASDSGRRRRARRAGAAHDPGARGLGPRLVRGAARVDRPRGGRRALRGAPLRGPAGQRGPPRRRRGHRARLGGLGGARGERGQAPGPPPAPHLTSTNFSLRNRSPEFDLGPVRYSMEYSTGPSTRTAEPGGGRWRRSEGVGEAADQVAVELDVLGAVGPDLDEAGSTHGCPHLPVISRLVVRQARQV